MGVITAEYFWGEASPLSDGALEKAARDLGVELACIRAVTDVEALGEGFYSKRKNGLRRPKILYESHKFGKYTDHKYDKSYPKLSTSNWRNNVYPKSEDDRFKQVVKASELEPPATEEYALMSCSWGMFQVLGMHAKTLKYKDVFDFVDRMKHSEDEHLECFVRFVKYNNLDRHLRALDFASFAHGYNGPAYKQNKYDTRMQERYEYYSGKRPAPVLKQGSYGADVITLQRMLNAAGYTTGVDGSFGPGTQGTVIEFQQDNNLVADGIVGAGTWAALETRAQAGPATAAYESQVPEAAAQDVVPEPPVAEEEPPGPVERMIQRGESKPVDKAPASEPTATQKKTNSNTTGTVVGGGVAMAGAAASQAENVIDEGNRALESVKNLLAKIEGHMDWVIIGGVAIVIFFALRNWLVNRRRDRDAI